MTKFYEVIDKQGMSFMDYTRSENWTKEDIRVHLRDQLKDQHEDEKIKDGISLDILLDIYELDIQEKRLWNS